MCITGKDASFDSKGNLSKGPGYIQAKPGEYFSVVVTVSPSDAHKNDLNFTQFQLGVSRIEFDENAVPTVVVGLNPTIQTLMGGTLTTTSTGRLVAKHGVIEISVTGGHTLSIPLDSSRYSQMNTADWMLTPKAKSREVITVYALPCIEDSVTGSANPFRILASFAGHNAALFPRSLKRFTPGAPSLRALCAKLGFHGTPPLCFLPPWRPCGA